MAVYLCVSACGGWRVVSSVVKMVCSGGCGGGGRRVCVALGERRIV